MSGELPLWVDLAVALLLAASGVFTLAAAVGVVRMRSFFQRLHPPALAFSISAWCVTLASIVYFSAQGTGLALQAWLIIIFLSVTVPVTTILLARTGLFRLRTAEATRHLVPPPLPVAAQRAEPAPGDKVGGKAGTGHAVTGHAAAAGEAAASATTAAERGGPPQDSSPGR
jgi:multicomponent K+:H+ antiporter subunit G